MVVVTIEGRTYRIPEMWLIGATMGPLKMSVPQAIQHWHEQALMDAEHKRRRIQRAALCAR